MYSTVYTGALYGLECCLVTVEVDISYGLPCFQMIGLPGSEVKEARDRVRVALKNSGYQIPALSIHVNLSPADRKKEGTGFDLPIVIGVLAALGYLTIGKEQDVFLIGEVGFDGEVKPVKGVLPLVKNAKEWGFSQVILPKENEAEGRLVEGIRIIGVSHLKMACEYLSYDEDSREEIWQDQLSDRSVQTWKEEEGGLDFKDVNGQLMIKRAATIAAAGFHNLLMIGPPGSGKTMIASRLPGILPPLTSDEALELAEIYSVAGLLEKDRPLQKNRPFINPHHSVTPQALTGGGRIPKPGLISLAHRGVLFLDELTEFGRGTLDLLRQPLEEKKILISRNAGNYRYPAEFMLVAACNPCPCGFYPDRNKCRCSEPEIRRYLQHVSGPLIDRMDLCVDTPPVSFQDLFTQSENETSEQIREKVMYVRSVQAKRFRDRNIQFNAEISGDLLDEFCALGETEKDFLEHVFAKTEISARSYHRILRVARTIADLEGEENIQKTHLAEALCYRSAVDKYWGK